MFFLVVLVSREEARRDLQCVCTISSYISKTWHIFAENMACKLIVAVVVFLSVSCFAKHSDPKVQVYSRHIGIYGQKNVLICHASGFHPPDITIELFKNGKEIPEAIQTDLAFQDSWAFELTKYVDFLPQSGEVYTCRVRHMTNTKAYTWEPDM